MDSIRNQLAASSWCGKNMEGMELGKNCIPFRKVTLSHRLEPTARPDPEGCARERVVGFFMAGQPLFLKFSSHQSCKRESGGYLKSGKTLMKQKLPSRVVGKQVWLFWEHLKRSRIMNFYCYQLLEDIL